MLENLLSRRVERRQFTVSCAKTALYPALLPYSTFEANRTKTEAESDSGIGVGRPFETFKFPKLVDDLHETINLEKKPLAIVHRSGNRIEEIKKAALLGFSPDADGNYVRGKWFTYHGNMRIVKLWGVDLTFRFDRNTMTAGFGKPETIESVFSEYRWATHGINTKPFSFELKRTDRELDDKAINKLYDLSIGHGINLLVQSHYFDRVDLARKIGEKRLGSDFDPHNYAYTPTDDKAWQRFFSEQDSEKRRAVITNAYSARKYAEQLNEFGVLTIVGDASRVATLKDLEQRGVLGGIMSDIENLSRFERCFKLPDAVRSRRSFLTVQSQL